MFSFKINFFNYWSYNSYQIFKINCIILVNVNSKIILIGIRFVLIWVGFNMIKCNSSYVSNAFKISLFGKCFIWLFVLLSILSKDLHVKKIWTDTNIEIFLMKKLKTCSNHLLHVFIHNSLHMYCYQVLSSRVHFFFSLNKYTNYR